METADTGKEENAEDTITLYLVTDDENETTEKHILQRESVITCTETLLPKTETSKKKRKPGQGRPVVPFDVERAKNMISLGFSMKQVSNACGISTKKLKRHNDVTGGSCNKYTNITDEELDAKVREIKSEHAGVGQKMLAGFLRSQNIRVVRERLRQSMYRVDPEGTLMRTKPKLNASSIEAKLQKKQQSISVDISSPPLILQNEYSPLPLEPKQQSFQLSQSSSSQQSPHISQMSSSHLPCEVSADTGSELVVATPDEALEALVAPPTDTSDTPLDALVAPSTDVNPISQGSISVMSLPNSIKPSGNAIIVSQGIPLTKSPGICISTVSKINKPIGLFLNIHSNCTAPNTLWRIDSVTKLERWGIVITFCVDMFSRLLLYALCTNAGTSSQNANLEHFREAVETYGSPTQVSIDERPEKLWIAENVIEEKGPEAVDIRSKLERYRWITILKNDLNNKIFNPALQIFNELENEGTLNIENESDLFCLHIVFLPILNKRMREFVSGYNSNPIPRGGGATPVQLFCAHSKTVNIKEIVGLMANNSRKDVLIDLSASCPISIEDAITLTDNIDALREGTQDTRELYYEAVRRVTNILQLMIVVDPTQNSGNVNSCTNNLLEESKNSGLYMNQPSANSTLTSSFLKDKVVFVDGNGATHQILDGNALYIQNSDGTIGSGQTLAPVNQWCFASVEMPDNAQVVMPDNAQVVMPVEQPDASTILSDDPSN